VDDVVRLCNFDFFLARRRRYRRNPEVRDQYLAKWLLFAFRSTRQMEGDTLSTMYCRAASRMVSETSTPGSGRMTRQKPRQSDLHRTTSPTVVDTLEIGGKRGE